jgi:hypothetical protein
MSKAQSALRHHLDQIAEAELVAQGPPKDLFDATHSQSYSFSVTRISEIRQKLVSHRAASSCKQDGDEKPERQSVIRVPASIGSRLPAAIQVCTSFRGESAPVNSPSRE